LKLFTLKEGLVPGRKAGAIEKSRLWILIWLYYVIKLLQILQKNLIIRKIKSLKFSEGILSRL